MKKLLISFLALLLPVLSQAGDYSSQLVVQTGLLRESDLVVRNITDLVSKKTCLAFYIRTAGTSSVIDCYDVVGDFGTTIRQVGHIKQDDVIIRKIEDTKNRRVCLVAYVATAGTSPAVDCYTTTHKFKDNLDMSAHLREGDLSVRRISDTGAMRTCLVAYVNTKGTSPSVSCYPSKPKGVGGLKQVSQMKEGDLVVRKIKDVANNKSCMVTYVSTAGTDTHLFCFDG
jgi:catabolite regulation protein CreA